MHNNAPTQNIDITLGNDLISAATAILEDSKETLKNSPVQTELDEGLILPTVEAYFNDASIIPPNEKSRIFLAACFGIVPGFDLGKEPYKI